MKNSLVVDYDYARGAWQPAWFDGRRPIELSATSGSSPLNEWASFDSREDALTILLNTAYESQDFVDNFEQIGDEVYDRREIKTAMDRLGYNADNDDYLEFFESHESEIVEGIEPADLRDIFRALSVF